jgi:hypothetical protein
VAHPKQNTPIHGVCGRYFLWDVRFGHAVATRKFRGLEVASLWSREGGCTYSNGTMPTQQEAFGQESYSPKHVDGIA